MLNTIRNTTTSRPRRIHMAACLFHKRAASQRGMIDLAALVWGVGVDAVSACRRHPAQS